MTEADIDTVLRIEGESQRHPWSRESFREEVERFPGRFFVLELKASTWLPASARGLARDCAQRVSTAVPRALPAGLHGDGEGTSSWVVGFAGCRQAGDEAYLLDIAIHPDFRRKGLGRALLGFLMERSRELGSSRMTLDVRAENDGAIRFYESLGFDISCERPRAYPDGAGAVVMGRRF